MYLRRVNKFEANVKMIVAVEIKIDRVTLRDKESNVKLSIDTIIEKLQSLEINQELK